MEGLDLKNPADVLICLTEDLTLGRLRQIIMELDPNNILGMVGNTSQEVALWNGSEWKESLAREIIAFLLNYRMFKLEEAIEEVKQTRGR